MSTHYERLSIPASSDASLAESAGRCVACGLCLPHCPTYRKTLSEADSPRGRIMLMKGMLEGAIPASERLAAHLDLCLTCRACEAVCPNHVAYGSLVDGVRGRLADQRKESPAARWVRRATLGGVVPHPRRIRWLAWALRAYQRSGVQALARASGLLKLLSLDRLEAELPPLLPARDFAVRYPAVGMERGRVALFLGCVAQVADAETLHATIFVLNRLGYTVEVPSGQACCGGLHRHAGMAGEAEKLERRNRQAFADPGLAALVTAASGCGAPLSEQGGIPCPVVDVSAWLVAAEGWDLATIAPLDATILVHDPCSLRNVIQAASEPYELLRRIPGARVEPLPGNAQCCGAAGAYFLSQPVMARMLLDDKMAALPERTARYLATSNIGCALALAKGLRETASPIEVAHPVTIVARQMGFRYP